MAKVIRQVYEDWQSAARQADQSGFGEEGLFARLSCVVYQADDRLQIVNITANAGELLGIESRHLLGASWTSNARVAYPDRELLEQRIGGLRPNEVACLTHRMIDDYGVVIDVAHSMQARSDIVPGGIQGCLIPIGRSARDAGLIPVEVVSKFIHKIGNHFQLLNLMFDSIRHHGANPKNVEALQQATETAIFMTREFSNLLQHPLMPSTVTLGELVDAAIDTKHFFGSDSGVSVEFDCGAADRAITVSGDASLLEQAIAAVIANAIEASARGAAVKVEICPPTQVLARFGPNLTAIRVVDCGSGIAAEQLSQLTQPFFTTKPGHEGIGLTLASRYLELHGGSIEVSSVEGAGTEVLIVLPVARVGRGSIGDGAIHQ